MKTETLIPITEAQWLAWRACDLTSTDTAALFGCNPYVTAFELHYRKAEGRPGAFEPNERMKWGQRLQAAIAAGIAEEQGWQVRPMTEYMRLPSERLGASFDFAIGDDGLLEVKNVDALQYRDGWLVDGDNVEAPPHIEIQIQHQLLVSGRQYTYLGALIGGNRIVLQRREPNEAVQSALLKKAKEFWARVDAGQPPPPDFLADAKFIARLYNYAEPGKLVDVDELPDAAAVAKLADAYRQAQNAAKLAKAEQDSLKAQLLTKIGTAEKVRGDGFTISAGLIGPTTISYEREGYRDFRINWKKLATQSAV